MTMSRALSLPFPNGLAVHDPRSFQGRPLSFGGFISVPPTFRKTSHCKTHFKHSREIRLQMGEEDDESVKQMKEMAAARKRWEALVRQGGWWSGATTLAYQTDFIEKVEEKFPKDADLIVACQKGLRSLAACEQLYNAGYRKLFWIQGGLESAEDGDFEREGPQPFKFAAIGGVSEFLGWTDQQRAAAAKEGWGYRLIFSARLVGLFLLADALFIGVQHAGSFLQDLRPPQ